jgi:hypothetical protein
MTTIRFDEADSWMALVEPALEDPETYGARCEIGEGLACRSAC